MRFLAACWRFWQMRGYLPEARDKANRIMQLQGGSDEVRLSALDAAGGVAYWQGDMFAAREWYEQEQALAEGLGDERAVAEAIYNDSFTYSLTPDETAKARVLAEDALERFRKLNDRGGIGKALWGVVNSYVFDDNVEPARALIDESLEITQELDDRFQLGWAHFTKGLILNKLGDPRGARLSYGQAMAIFRETEDVTGYALVLDGLAVVDWGEGDRVRAMTIAGAATEIRNVQGVGLADINRQTAQFYPEDLLDDPELAEAYAEGRKLTVDQAIALALHEDEAQAG